MRVQEAVRVVFARFRQLGSARQVLLSLAAEGMHFPRPSDGKTMVSFDWTPIRYRNVISILKNPFYAGAHAYGKSEKRTALVDGRVRTTYKHRKPFGRWEVIIKDHHEGYLEWSEFERNQKLLAANAYGKAGGVKSGRGGRALLPGLLLCGGCGCRLMVAYSGHYSQPVYRRERPNQMLGRPRCMTFGAKRVDVAIGRELLRAIEDELTQRIVLTHLGPGGILGTVRAGHVVYQRILTYTMRSVTAKMMQMLLLTVGLPFTGHGLRTFMKVTLVFVIQATFYVVRDHRWICSSPPSRWILGSSVIDVPSILFNAARELLLRRLSWCSIGIKFSATALFVYFPDFVRSFVFVRLNLDQPSVSLWSVPVSGTV